MGVNEYAAKLVAAVLLVASLAVAAVLLLRLRGTRQPVRDTFLGYVEGPQPQTNELTAAAKDVADPLKCTVNGYSFASEGLAMHLRSSPTDPKCVLVRDGMGLLDGDDPKSCRLTRDDLENNWANPLGQAGAILKVYPDHVGALDRCVISFDPDASVDDLRQVDNGLRIAGAEARSGMPLVLKKLELTTATLTTTTASLSVASQRMTSDAAQMKADAEALGVSDGRLKAGLTLLQALQTMMTSGTMKTIEETYKKMLASCSVAAAAAAPAAAGSTPGKENTVLAPAQDSKDVQIFTEKGFTGERATLTDGRYGWNKGNFPVKNDAIVSIKVPLGKMVTVFEDEFGGYSAQFIGDKTKIDIADLSLDSRNRKQGHWGWNISSIIVESFTADSVLVFTDKDYGGTMAILRDGEYGWKKGNFPLDNDSIMSIKVPVGKMVTVYENDFDGYSAQFRGTTARVELPDLSKNSTTRKGDWGKNISSMRIESFSYTADVLVFTAKNYDGTMAILKDGEYGNRKGNFPIANDSIVSIKIPVGKQVTVFEDDFGGYSAVFKGTDKPDLSTDTTARSNGSHWGWNISSIIVKSV